MNNNLFLKPKIEKSDIYLLGMMSVTIVVFIIGYLQSSSLQNFGTIYFYVAIFTFIVLSIALATRQKTYSWVLFGKIKNSNDFFKLAGIGIFLGLILNLGIIGLSVSIPLNISASSSSSNLINYIIITFFGVLIEEIFWIGMFVPTLINYTSKLNDIFMTFYADLIALSILIMYFAVDYFGAIGIIYGILVLLLALIFLRLDIISRTRKRIIKSSRFIPSLLAGVVLITALHIYSYGNILTDISAYISIFLFFLIEGIVDYQLQSILPSIMMHTVNNAIVASTAFALGAVLGIPIWVLSIGFMFLFLYVIFSLGFAPISIKKYNVIESFVSRR